MNISGLSYLQFALVDGVAAVYLLLRVCETRAWSRINPVSVLRQGPSTRGSGLATMVGYFSCVAATVLFLVKDGLMAHQELQDVALCRAAVYLREEVTPTDAQQLPVIKTGLLLWDLGSALQILALGCAVSLWAARPLRRLLDPQPPMSAAAGAAMLGLGVLGCTAIVIAHFVAFRTMDSAGSARSVARVVSSGLALAFAAVLCWVIVRVTLAVRRTRRRDPYATATAVSAALKLDTQGGRPMATLQHLLGVQTASFMNETAKLLVLVLGLRAVFFLVFDVAFLAQSQSIIADMAANNVYTGLGTLAASLTCPLIAQLLLPARLEVLADVLGAAGGMSQPDRIAFIDAQLNAGAATVHMAQLSPTLTPRGRGPSSTLGSKSRSRAPTAASLAVEKLLGSDAAMPPVLHHLPLQASRDRLPAAVPGSHGAGYLGDIPYIDRDTRESSFFTHGPWTQSPAYSPYTPTPHASLRPSTGECDSSTVANVFGRPAHGVGAHPVPANPATDGGGNLLITLRRSTLRDNQNLPGDHGDGSRSELNDSFVPLPSPGSATAPGQSGTSDSYPSGPSLHAVALADPGSDGRDSIASAYARPESALPPVQRIIYEPRPSSFVSEDYQYYPLSAGDGGSKSSASASNPFDDDPRSTAPPADHQHVYVASPPPAEDTAGDEPDSASDPRLMSGLGPFLMRKGSKASLRRKNKLEQHGQRAETAADELQSGRSSVLQPRDPVHLDRQGRLAAGDGDDAGNSSDSSTGGPAIEPERSAAYGSKKSSVHTLSRMSAFYGAADPAPAYGGSSAAVEAEEVRRDSATISNMSWEQRAAAAQPPVPASVGASYVSAPVMHHYTSFRPGGESTAPASLFKRRGDSNASTSSRRSSGVASFSSHLGGNEAFYTPEASMAEFAEGPQPAATAHDGRLMTAVPLEPPSMAASAQDNRPSTAPSSTQRHTVGASGRVAPPMDADDDSNDNDAGNALVRRAQTLRRAMDTDALALESSIQVMAGSDDAGALISALPMPAQEHDSQTLGGGRVII